MNYVELFAGSGGMSLGLHRAGFHPLSLVEWDKSAAGVLAYKWPDVPLFSDVTKFTGEEVTGKVDLLAFGSPCQDLSVAGRRAGFQDGSRSSLFFHAIRIANRLRISNGLRFLLWENVVGALSSNQGADFAAVLGEMGNLGARDIAWRVLDSQWFGVPQRRRRVFVVADLGGERAAEILSLAEGMSGNPAPSRKAGQRLAGTLSKSPDGGRIAGTLDLKSCSANRGSQANESDFIVAQALQEKGVNPGQFFLGGQSLARCLTTKNTRNDPETETLIPTHQGGFFSGEIAHTLRGEGFDASEDGTGQGTPLVVTPILEAGARTGVSTTDPRAGSGIGEAGDPMFTLQATKQHAIAFNWQAAGNQTTLGASHEGTNTLGANQVPAVCFNLRGREEGAQPEITDTASVRAASGGSSRSYVALTGVRRLTPRECERLQGWPDDHTLYRRELILNDNRWIIKPDTDPVQQADGPRYKQCGNGVTSNVAEYIGRRIIQFSS